jgi:hypothetical protein
MEMPPYMGDEDKEVEKEEFEEEEDEQEEEGDEGDRSEHWAEGDYNDYGEDQDEADSATESYDGNTTHKSMSYVVYSLHHKVCLFELVCYDVNNTCGQT